MYRLNLPRSATACGLNNAPRDVSVPRPRCIFDESGLDFGSLLLPCAAGSPESIGLLPRRI